GVTAGPTLRDLVGDFLSGYPQVRIDRVGYICLPVDVGDLHRGILAAGHIGVDPINPVMRRIGHPGFNIAQLPIHEGELPFASDGVLDGIVRIDVNTVGDDGQRSLLDVLRGRIELGWWRPDCLQSYGY